MEEHHDRTGLRGQLKNTSGVGALHRGDLEDELDLVRDEEAAGLERGVPDQAPVPAVQGGRAVPTRAGVAVRVLGDAVELPGDIDGVGHPGDGEVAGGDDLIAVDLHGRAREGDAGVLCDLEEVGAAQVAVALVVAGGDAVGVDVHPEAAALGVLHVDRRAPGEDVEVPARGGDHRVLGGEAHGAVDRVDVPGPGQLFGEGAH